MTILAKEDVKQIAETILKQLGGNKFCFMTDAKHLSYSTDETGNPYLEFEFKGCKKANYCRITLMPEDLYKLEFMKIFKHDFKKILIEEGIYDDMLYKIFENFTGLATRIGKVFIVKKQ